MSVVFLFPGQGSQRAGMASELKAGRPDLFDHYFEKASDRSGLPLGALCIDGTLDDLTPTNVAQPAIFTLSVALNFLAQEGGVEPALVAGHSLGEYSAAVAAGALDWEEGLSLVALRGRLMAEIQRVRPGAMGAVVGLKAADIEELCASAHSLGLVVLANHNSELQSVVSGEVGAVERVLELAREGGAEQTVRLQVGAAFHSPLMEPVRAPMAEALQKATWRDPRCPIASNASGELIRTAAEVRDSLIEQITSRVRWFDCMRTLIDAGGRTFLELGPGRVLTGQVRLTDRELDAVAADGPRKLDHFTTSHQELMQR